MLLIKKTQLKFLWALGPAATHSKTQSDYKIDSGKIETDEVVKLLSRYYVLFGNKYSSDWQSFAQNKQKKH